ncbi:MAG: N-acetylmuramoyl-L-alanine amidase family protein [Lachnospiraceae bacterium]|jgi:glucan-binding YG repeat protein|nr:N-acetylmuramoyl-L-alanine amidase family protein [Lachnospiraceae bacterium]
MKRIQSGVLGFIVGFMAVFQLTGFTAAAASTISSISIRIKVEVEAGGTLPNLDIINGVNEGYSGRTNFVYTSNSKYHITEYEWLTSQSTEMDIGDRARLKVYLIATDPDSNYFKSSYSSSSVTVTGGEYVSSSRKSTEDLEITLRTDYLSGTYSTPENLDWDEDHLGRALWDGGEFSSGAFDIYLYRGNSRIHSVTAYKGYSYNFYPYMTREGDYTFRVRTVPYTDTEKQYGSKSDWAESGDLYIDDDETSDGTGQDGGSNVVQENASGSGSSPGNPTQVGWIKTGNVWYYRYPDGTYQKDSWLKVKDKWYLFDANGKMLTGWQNRNGQTYYLRDDGDMQVGWLLYGGKWYFFNSNAGSMEGAMLRGWIQVNGKIYYLNESGVMVEGWQKVGDNWYYFYPGQGHKAVNTDIDGFHVDADGIWRK